jgi:integrase
MAGKAKKVVPFNDKAVARIARQRTAKQTEWKIEGVPGLSLAVKPSGTATYYVRYQAGTGAARRQRREAIGRHGLIPLHEARKRALAIMSKVAEGCDPVADAASARDALTLRSLFDERIAKDARTAPRTLDDYRLVLESNVFDALAMRPAGAITADDIAAVLARIEVRSKHTAHKARAALGSTYRWGLKRRLVKMNPVAGLGFTHQSRPRNRVASEQELAKLWAAIGAAGLTPPMKLILKLAILTGQRNSEVAGAEIAELRLNTANPNWRIPSERMKRKNREQIVPLSTQAAALFYEAVELAKVNGGKYVFPGASQGRRKGTWRAGHLAQESVSRAMRRVRDAAEIEGLWLHDMRRSITTWLREHRRTPRDVCDLILHHSRADVTGTTYDWATLEGPVREAFQAWGDHLETIAARTARASAEAVPLRSRAAP